MLVLHAGAAYAVWKLFHGGFGATAWTLFGLKWTLIVLFTTIVHHRYVTHRAFTIASAKVRKAMYAGTTITFQGPALEWGENHWRHHAYTDVNGDPHRPTEFGGGLKGFLWAHVGWIFFDLAPAPSREYRPSPHFREDAELEWQKNIICRSPSRLASASLSSSAAWVACSSRDFSAPYSACISRGA
jgi:fatty-acid desaturase